MNPERIKIQHRLDQLWQRLKSKECRGDIKRIANQGSQPNENDRLLIKAVFHFISAKMDTTDFDREST
jgi:hypothetical protein